MFRVGDVQTRNERSSMEAQHVGAMAGMEVVEQADGGGIRDERMLRGDGGVVRERRERAVSGSRARAAVQAALDKIVATGNTVPIAAATLRKEREAVAERGNIVAKTAGKVATDEHTWELYVEEQGLQIGDYPSEEQTVEFAVWLSLRRERACLAQRAEAGARLSGLVKRTVRNMRTELFTHAWPRRWPAFAALEKKEKAAYEDAILKQVDGLHKQAALTMNAVRFGGDRTRDRSVRSDVNSLIERVACLSAMRGRRMVAS